MQQTKSQLACIAALFWEDEAKLAKERMMVGGKGLSPEKQGDTRNILSKRFGVSAGYVQVAKKIMENDLELFYRIKNGEENIPGEMINPRKKITGSFALYRAFDKDGNLLYVGITSAVGERMKAHALGSEWWDEFETLKVDRNFTSRIALESAESFAIKNENPKYNILGS